MTLKKLPLSKLSTISMKLRKALCVSANQLAVNVSDKGDSESGKFYSNC